MKKSLYLIFYFLLLIQTVSFADHAEEQTAGDYFVGIGTKFGRGIENIVTSPAEIPCTVEDEMHQGDRIIRFFGGIGKGTVFFLRRALVGVTEVASFMIPMERTIPRVCTEKPAAENTATA